MTTELDIALNAARAAATVLRDHFSNLTNVQMRVKSDEDVYEGIVTSADLEAEKSIVAAIRHSFPNDEFLAEEEHSATQDVAAIERLWIIDPIDGTNNFANGISHYAISIAFYEKGIATCGAVLKPETHEEFFASRGQGAWHRRIDGSIVKASVNQHQSLNETMVGVGFYYDRGEMMRRTLKAIETLFESKIHGIRRMGTAALDIVQVGLGCFGGFFEYQLSPWDFAAAKLFLEEAGGMISTCSGDPLPIDTSSVLASNGRLHDAILSIVSKNDKS